MKCLPIALFLFLLLICQPTSAQYSLQQSETLFRQNNLLLLAEQYNIQAARAAVIQARIWELPYLSVELNALNPQDSRVLDVGGRGQKALAIQQLIYMGGKKKNEIEFAKSNAELAELYFEQLVRTLRFQLREHYYSLYFDLKKMESLRTQAARVDTLTQAYGIQVQRGNIPLKDLVRLQSLSLGIKNELLSLQKDVIGQQRDLSLLTGVPLPFVPAMEEAALDQQLTKTQLPGVDQLTELAMENNPDYRLVVKMQENKELFLKWQRSLASPDLTAGASYDQRGGAFANQVNVTLGIPLPLWNRNRGAIKIAESEQAQARIQKEYTSQELRQQIGAAVQVWEQQSQQYRLFTQSNQDLDRVYNSVLVNFRRGNIPLLEFTDFMESYHQTVQQLNELRKQVILSGEAINQLTNSMVF